MLLFKGRLLVAHFTAKPAVHLIRYASMVARVNHSLRAETFAWPPTCAAPPHSRAVHTPHEFSQRTAAEAPEVRFVALLPPGLRDAARNRSTRARFRGRVNKYFKDPSDNLAVGCDLLHGQSVRRLLSFAEEFDSGLILASKNGASRSKLERLAMQSPSSVWIVPSGWAPVLRRILVPIDFTDTAAATLQSAVSLARRFPRAKCLALHVDRDDTRFRGDTIQPARRRELQARFATLLRSIDSAGVPIVPVFVKGHHVDRSIRLLAEQHSPDLVVMASRGRSRIARLMLPSIVAATIRNISSPLLVLRSGQPVGFRTALRERLASEDDPHFC